MDRRRFISTVAQAGVLSVLPTEWAQAFPLKKELQPFPLFIDVLLPETDTPSASQLMVHIELIKHANNIKNYPELIKRGCFWLNKQAQTKFHKMSFINLSDAEKIVIVKQAEKSKNGDIAKLFFERIKQDAFWFYYAHPETWRVLGFEGPPQPNGYLNYTKPPRI